WFAAASPRRLRTPPATAPVVAPIAAPLPASPATAPIAAPAAAPRAAPRTRWPPCWGGGDATGACAEAFATATGSTPVLPFAQVWHSDSSLLCCSAVWFFAG